MKVVTKIFLLLCCISAINVCYGSHEELGLSDVPSSYVSTLTTDDKRYKTRPALHSLGEVGDERLAETEERRRVSFDRLYPETSASRALRSLRKLFSLAYEGYQESAAQVRTAWLDVYNAINALNQENIEQDLLEYIKAVWLYIEQVHDEIELEDPALAGFVSEMRKACEGLIRSTRHNQTQYTNTSNQH